jgi:hypothetical protein
MQAFSNRTVDESVAERLTSEVVEGLRTSF